MAELSSISGIGKTSLDLLEAVGIRNAEELAAQDTDSLFLELERANAVLLINKRAPGRSTVRKWIADASDLDAAPAEDEKPAAAPVPELRPAVNHEANPRVAEMLSRAPCAIPLPGRVMMREGLAVADVSPGLLLNRYSGDLEVRVDDSTASAPVVSGRRPSGNLETIEMKGGRRHSLPPPSKQMTPSHDAGKRLPKSRRSGSDDRVSQIRAPHEETNRGKDPQSRRFVRGVLHTHPWGLRVGAFFSIMLLANIPLAIIAALLLLLFREFPGTFPWVRQWFLAFPAALPVVGVGFLTFAYQGKCRICCQKLFVPNRAHKHMKAHHLPGIGYIVPLSLHLLWFSWFRCSSCGTPVRLKK